MPNWIYNVLSSHDENGKNFICDHCVDINNNFTFSKLIPMPEIANWYDWRINNWGCKWDAKTDKKIDREYDFDFSFETPWSPPEGFIKKFVLEAYQKTPKSTFTWWWEEEQGFGQEIFIEAGHTTIMKEWDIPNFFEHQINILLNSGEERHIMLTKVSGGDPDRYGNGGWYADENDYYYYETALQALGNAVSQQIVHIINIGELLTCIHGNNIKNIFCGIENKFSQELKKLIQKDND